jgi:glycosyltransferase involved in cell wall biosynthesis
VSLDLKILYFSYDDINNPWCGGGGSKRSLEFAKRIKYPNEVTIITGNYPNAKNITTGNIKFLRSGSHKNNLLSRITYSLIAKNLIKREKPDVIIVSFHELAPIIFFKKTKTPVIGIIHHVLGWHSFRKFLIFGFIPHICQYFGVRGFPNIITVSKQLEVKLRNKYPQKNIRFIPNGVEKISAVKSNINSNYILWFGRVDIYMKGLDILVEAFRAVSKINPEIKLILAGRSDENRLRKLLTIIRNSNINNIDVMVNVSEKQKKELFTNCLFYCMPSRYEGWGITAVEAAACGKAIIATDISGLKEAVKNNYNGLLVEPENIDALSSAMITLIKDAELRKKFETNSVNWAKNFLWDSTFDQEYNLIKEILETK